jgi:hypothetical protein
MKHSCFSEYEMHNIIMSKRENQAFQAIILHSLQRSSLSKQYDSGKYLKQVLHEMHEWKRTCQLIFRNWECYSVTSSLKEIG